MPPSADRRLLPDKVAVVTGGAAGIGRATAELFAREGAQVMVADLDTRAGHECVARIEQAGGRAAFIEADVGSMSAVESLISATVARCGRLDVIHSNAYHSAVGTATAITEDDWERTLDVSLKATWMLAHHGFPAMLAGGGGAMVITSSIHAVRGFARSTAYQAAKGGLVALTRALATDYGPEIRVNAVLPGPILTPGQRHTPRSWIEVTAGQTILGRFGRAEEVAQAVLFLASDMSSYVTGTSLVVDGGHSCAIQMPAL